MPKQGFDKSRNVLLHCYGQFSRKKYCNDKQTQNAAGTALNCIKELIIILYIIKYEIVQICIKDKDPAMSNSVIFLPRIQIWMDREQGSESWFIEPGKKNWIPIVTIVLCLPQFFSLSRQIGGGGGGGAS